MLLQPVPLLRTNTERMPRWSQAVIAVGAVVVLFYLYSVDPEQGGFLACPFRYLTGLLCPGCGSQRALHDLLHGRVLDAFAHNALLLITLPVLLVYGLLRPSQPRVRAWATNNKVVWTSLFVILAWGIGRNLW